MKPRRIDLIRAAARARQHVETRGAEQREYDLLDADETVHGDSDVARDVLMGRVRALDVGRL